jgi:hypothetical protein
MECLQFIQAERIEAAGKIKNPLQIYGSIQT